jgi:UDP-N-acetylmuramate: L-alanyl-gamma-D-glutamyl-meso-diaminopimelate ligase
MMARVLDVAGRDPSMMVGGLARDFGTNYRLGGGGEFVIEGDEYDTAFFDKGPKFLHYGADGAIITAVEFARTFIAISATSKSPSEPLPAR